MTATKTAARTAANYDGFTDEERAAMKQRAQELKSTARRGRGRQLDGESAALAKIAEMPEADRAMAEQLHALIKKSVPSLATKTWYGMPAYTKNGKIVCYFQPADKFTTRYATFAFNDTANLDDGTMWPTAFALTKLTAADLKTIAALVQKAAG